MSPSEMVAVVQKQLDAYNARSIDAFVECFHQEVVVEALVAGKRSISGREEFREAYTGFFAENPALHCELINRVVLDKSVLDEELVTGAAVFANGLHTVAIYAFRDGLIDRVWFPS